MPGPARSSHEPRPGTGPRSLPARRSLGSCERSAVQISRTSPGRQGPLAAPGRRRPKSTSGGPPGAAAGPSGYRRRLGRQPLRRTSSAATSERLGGPWRERQQGNRSKHFGLRAGPLGGESASYIPAYVAGVDVAGRARSSGLFDPVEPSRWRWRHPPRASPRRAGAGVLSQPIGRSLGFHRPTTARYRDGVGYLRPAGARSGPAVHRAHEARRPAAGASINPAAGTKEPLRLEPQP
jgi:hypothetical protein